MKKLIIAVVFILFSGVAFGQTLQKGSLLGMHHATLTLNPGVTMDQYFDYMNEKMIPAVEKQFPGVKLFVMKGDRGEMKNEIAFLWYFKTVKDRDMYFNAEGELTEKGMAAQVQLLPMMEAGEKLGTYTTTHTDWILQ